MSGRLRPLTTLSWNAILAGNIRTSASVARWSKKNTGTGGTIRTTVAKQFVGSAQRIADFVGELKWFQRAGGDCEDSREWLAVETMADLELIVSARE